MDLLSWDTAIKASSLISGGILAFSKQLAEKFPKLKWIDRLGFKLPAAVCLIVLTIIASEQKSKMASEAAQKAKRIADSTAAADINERDIRHEKREDSLSLAYSAKVDSSYTKSIIASNKALGEFNLRLNDSLRRVESRINAKSRNIPQLSLIPKGMDSLDPIYLESFGTFIQLHFRLMSKEATSRQINICFYVLKYPFSSFEILQQGQQSTNKVLVTDVASNNAFVLTPEVLRQNRILLILRGTFSPDVEGGQQIAFREVCEVDIPGKKYVSHILSFKYKEFEKYIKDNNNECPK